MQQVFTHHDSAHIGLLDGVLNESGIPTLLKNWTGSNIVEVPIPSLYPAIFVLNDADAGRARRIIDEYLNHKAEDLPNWQCPHCKSDVDGYLSECWSCQTARDGA
jgi:hypothetical protein